MDRNKFEQEAASRLNRDKEFLENKNNIMRNEQRFRLKADDAINELAWIIDSKANKIFHSIDNMTATTNLNRQINLEDFIRLNSEYKDYITYNPETFTGLFVRGKKGKAILFKNGKVVFVGCKDKRQLIELYDYIIELCGDI